MSQIWVPISSSTPLPPEIPTEFTPDEGDPAVPTSNNLNLLAQDTIENDDNGIRTAVYAPTPSDTIYVELTNRTTRTVTTTDNSPTVIFQETVGADQAVINVWGSVQAYNVTLDLASTFEFAGAYRVINGTNIVELAVEYSNEFYDSGMEDTDIILSCSALTTGTDIIITVYGLNGSSIKWNCLFQYRILPKV